MTKKNPQRLANDGGFIFARNGFKIPQSTGVSSTTLKGYAETETTPPKCAFSPF